MTAVKSLVQLLLMLLVAFVIVAVATHADAIVSDSAQSFLVHLQQ